MRSSLVIILLFLLSPPTEAKGTFGVGLQLGSPTTLTGRYLYDKKQGIAFHLGTHLKTSLFHKDKHERQHLRVQHEQQFADLARWRFADLGAYFNIGGVLRAWDDHWAIGPSGGLGLELWFRKFPMILFFEADLQLYLLGDEEHSGGDLGLYEGLGGRWYF